MTPTILDFLRFDDAARKELADLLVAMERADACANDRRVPIDYDAIYKARRDFRSAEKSLVTWTRAAIARAANQPPGPESPLRVLGLDGLAGAAAFVEEHTTPRPGVLTLATQISIALDWLESEGYVATAKDPTP